MAGGLVAARISQNTLVAVIWLLVGTALIFLAARIVIHLYTFRRLHLDDYFASTAFVILIANGVVMTVMSSPMYELLEVSTGLRQPTPDFVQRGSYYIKCQFASTLLFWTCLWSVKASFLAFLHRLTKQLNGPRRVWWLIVGLTVLTIIASIISYPMACTSFTPGECQDPASIRKSLISLRMSTAFDISTDVCIIVLPIYVVAGVDISRKQKAGLMFVLGLGILVIAFAITRISFSDTQNSQPEISWLALWSAVESSVAVIVCCLASFRILYTAKQANSSAQPYYIGSASARFDGNGRSRATGNNRGQVCGIDEDGDVPLHRVSAPHKDDTLAKEPFRSDSSSQVSIMREAGGVGTKCSLDRERTQ